MSNDQLYNALKDVADRVQQNFPLSKLTTFKLGGPARYVVTVSSVENLQKVIEIASENDLEFFILGGGSNMLVSDEGYDGIAIRLQLEGVAIDGEVVIAQAGAKTVTAAQKCSAEGLTGFEWGVGVPGTIGGAVRGNAGAMDGEMKDVVTEVQAIIDGEVVTLKNADCEFGYRHSAFKENGGIILSATLELKKGDPKIGLHKMQEFLKYRMETQPKGFASTGCIFKNVEITDDMDLSGKNISESFIKNKRIPAGWLVQEAGLKGEKVGGAQVSQDHGNFIINDKTATATDVKALIDLVKQKVYNEYELELKEEIQLIGF